MICNVYKRHRCPSDFALVQESSLQGLLDQLLEQDEKTSKAIDGIEAPYSLLHL